MTPMPAAPFSLSRRQHELALNGGIRLLFPLPEDLRAAYQQRSEQGGSSADVDAMTDRWIAEVLTLPVATGTMRISGGRYDGQLADQLVITAIIVGRAYRKDAELHQCVTVGVKALALAVTDPMSTRREEWIDGVGSAQMRRAA